LQERFERFPNFRFVVDDEDSAALSGCVRSGVLRRGIVVTSDTAANSDMDGLPRRYQWKIQGEGSAFARTALHANVARVFLDDAVGDR